MANDRNHGGRRKNTDPVVVGFREFCRNVVSHPEVKAKIEAAARANPEFALRVAEHGYGRPPQALDVSHNTGQVPLEFRILDVNGAAFAFGGGDLPAHAVPVPAKAPE